MGVDNVSYGYAGGLIWQDAPDSILAFDRVDTGTTGSSAEKDDVWTVGSPHKDQGGNLLFLDGHVEFETKFPFRVLDGNDAVTNVDADPGT